jgi:DNA repair protein SbcD/Mre11
MPLPVSPRCWKRIRAGLEEGVAGQAEGRLLACRLVLEGRAPMHGQLVGAEEYLLAEARAIALGLGADQAWVERVKVVTEPEMDARTLAARTDALGELHRMLGEAGGDPDLLAQLGEDPGQMLLRLPHEVRTDAEADSVLKAALEGDQQALVAGVLPYLSSRLTMEED